MLASSVARHPSCLTSLAFSSTPLAAAVSIDAITTFLQRSNIEELRLEKCELDANTCCEIVTSLDGNTALRELRIVGNNNNNGTSMLDSMSVTVIGRSCLRDLRLVDVTLTASVVRALADGLRGNITLESLSLASTGHPCAPEPFEDLLRHYNVTLQSVALQSVELDGSTPEALRSLLLVNERVRVVHSHLQLRQYRMMDLSSLWSCVLARLSSKPNLFFRFLRHNSAMWCCGHQYLQQSHQRRLPEATPSPQESKMGCVDGWRKSKRAPIDLT